VWKVFCFARLAEVCQAERFGVCRKPRHFSLRFSLFGGLPCLNVNFDIMLLRF